MHRCRWMESSSCFFFFFGCKVVSLVSATIKKYYRKEKQFMKKTKLLTSLAALALVLGLGACEETVEDDSTSQSGESTNSSESSGDSTDDDTDCEGDECQTGGPVWEGSVESPADLVEKAYVTGNYSVEIQYDYYRSEETISFGDYISGGDAYDSMMASVGLNQSYLIDLYYTQDYIYVEEYALTEEEYLFTGRSICVNTEEGLWEYFYPYDATTGGWGYYTPEVNAAYGLYTWQDEYNSLFDAYENDLGEALVYQEGVDSSKYIDATCPVYDFDDWTYDYWYGMYESPQGAEWFCDLGGDWLYYDCYDFALYEAPHAYSFFFEEYEALTSWYLYDYISSAGDGSYFYGEEDIYMSVYDAGSTDESETVYYYHNLLQQSING